MLALDHHRGFVVNRVVGQQNHVSIRCPLQCCSERSDFLRRSRHIHDPPRPACDLGFHGGRVERPISDACDPLAVDLAVNRRLIPARPGR